MSLKMKGNVDKKRPVEVHQIDELASEAGACDTFYGEDKAKVTPNDDGQYDINI